MERYCLVGTKVQFGKMKPVLGVDGGNGCTTVLNELNVTEVYT